MGQADQFTTSDGQAYTDQPSSRLQPIREMCKQGMYGRAIELLKGLIDQYPDNLEVHELLTQAERALDHTQRLENARFSASRGDWETALKQLDGLPLVNEDQQDLRSMALNNLISEQNLKVKEAISSGAWAKGLAAVVKLSELGVDGSRLEEQRNFLHQQQMADEALDRVRKAIGYKRWKDAGQLAAEGAETFPERGEFADLQRQARAGASRGSLRRIILIAVCLGGFLLVGILAAVMTSDMTQPVKTIVTFTAPPKIKLSATTRAVVGPTSAPATPVIKFTETSISTTGPTASPTSKPISLRLCSDPYHDPKICLGSILKNSGRMTLIFIYEQADSSQRYHLLFNDERYDCQAPVNTQGRLYCPGIPYTVDLSILNQLFTESSPLPLAEGDIYLRGNIVVDAGQ